MTTIIPVLRYNDAKKAIAWLEEAFGMSASEVTLADNGSVVHAQMFHGDGCVMLGTSDHDSNRGDASSLNGIYVVVEDVDAHCQQAKAAGAEIGYEPHDTEYGSREYGAKDFEGNSWSFGTYKPTIP
ncbi:MAG: VOC family protein [Chloroflexia bacterium]|jgi:uncharacterized glyoxalase superfamily protein PhnB|nr:VOC family protein [Chloroflexia bacterium]